MFFFLTFTSLPVALPAIFADTLARPLSRWFKTSGVNMALDSITGSISWKKGKWNSNVVNQIQLQDECSSLKALLIFNTDKSRKLRTEDHPCLVVIILCGSLVRREKHKMRMTCTAGQLLDKIKNDQKVLERELSIVCLFVQCCFETSQLLLPNRH